MEQQDKLTSNEQPKIYIASKTKHADKWLQMRSNGVNFNSTWIYEAGEGKSPNLADLCRRCIKEVLEADVVIVYSEEGDYLKGAFIEMGVALSVPLKPIYLVGPVLPYGSAFTYSHQVFTAKTVEEAIKLNKEQEVKVCDASKAEQGGEAGNKTPLISKGGAEVEKLATSYANYHWGDRTEENKASWDDEFENFVSWHKHGQALTQKAGDGWKERLSADDFLKDPSQNTYHSLWDKELETFSVDYINEQGLPPVEAERLLKAVCDGAEWAKQFLEKQ